MKVYKSSGEKIYYMVVYPEQKVAIGVWKEEEKDRWHVYKYAGYHRDIHTWIDKPTLSNTLEILVLSGLTEERLLELALSIPLGLEQVV